ncbi:MAG: N,N-dimethylformamidase beta subunit family domain-containing protein [Sphingorhabdus sp.]
MIGRAIIAAYTDRLSIRPGEAIELKASVTGAGPCTAEIVRILHGDPNPAGPGLLYEAVPEITPVLFPARTQHIDRGSYGVATIKQPFPENGLGLTLGAVICPTLPAKGDQAVLSLPLTHNRRLTLVAGPKGAGLRISSPAEQDIQIDTQQPFHTSCWYALCAVWNQNDNQLHLYQWPLNSIGPPAGVHNVALACPTLAITPGLAIIAADPDNSYLRFDGRIELPYVAATAVRSPATPPEGRNLANLFACWDFSIEIPSLIAKDIGPFGFDATLINMPTRAVRSSGWTGDETCWRHAPTEYGAIHFHADDLDDCRWDTVARFELPYTLPSGIYGIRICHEASGLQDIPPFFVRPGKGQTTARFAYLAPTLTYTAYANHARGLPDEAWLDRSQTWHAATAHPGASPQFGLSSYHHHADGSGVAYVSRLRPNLVMRPGFVDFVDERGSGVRHFAADTHLTYWLHHMGHDFDVITDEDLDEEGTDLLAPYAAVITSSHPEYHTDAMLNALETYRDQGGAIAYLGGNGFYWRIARHCEQPATIEVRRAEGGIRLWAAQPGEYHHSVDGRLGGLWRRLDRPPQRLVGVGFSAQGLFRATHYVKTAAASSPEFAWLFAGIEGDILGDFGFSAGGAAGYELDRADPKLGTPPEAVVLAQSVAPDDSFVVVPEEWLSHVQSVTGEPFNDLLRADMIYADLPNGGALFSVGSITFCGSLMHNDGGNSISRLLDNLLRHFAARHEGR